MSMRDEHTARRRRAFEQPRRHAQPEPPAAAPGGHEEGQSRLMFALRYVLPAVVAVAGAIVMALGSDTDLEGGAGILSAGLAIYFINWLFRAGAEGDMERQREAEARDYFDRHGRWPT